jgi:hypothetical protein
MRQSGHHTYMYIRADQLRASHLLLCQSHPLALIALADISLDVNRERVPLRPAVRHVDCLC